MAIVGIVLGVIGIPTLCCCGGGIAFLVWDQKNTTAEIGEQLRDNPILVEEIGELEDFSIDLASSMQHDDPDMFFYDAKGSKGKAEVRVKWDVSDDFEVIINWASIVSEDGVERTLTGQDDPRNFKF